MEKPPSPPASVRHIFLSREGFSSPLYSHRGLRGSASHPWPTDEVRLEQKSTPRKTGAHHRNVEKIKRLPQRRHRTKNRGLPSGNPGRNCIYKLTPPYPGESFNRVAGECAVVERLLSESPKRPSRFTRSITSGGTSERAVTHK